MNYNHDIILELFSETLNIKAEYLKISEYYDEDKILFWYNEICVHPKTLDIFLKANYVPFIKKKTFKEKLNSI